MPFEVDEIVLSLLVPFCVYWLTALTYESLSATKWSWLEKYRLHTLEHEKHFNRVSRRLVVPTVLAQHALQMVAGILLLDKPDPLARPTWFGQGVRLVGAIICLDTWQFAFHRLFHEVPWFYNNIHYWHHQISVPYAFGALYQHPFEMLVMDTLSGTVAAGAVGLTPRSAMLFWSLSYFKTVSDHSGFKFPINPTNIRGINNAEYHDIHHMPTGLHYNFSQPYLTFWDRVYGCYKDPYDGVPLPDKKLL